MRRKTKNSIYRSGHDAGDEERAVLRVQKSTYEQLARSTKTWGVPDWAQYNALVEKCIEKGGERGWPVKVYEGTDTGIVAFMHATGRDFNPATLFAYAAHLLGRESRNDGSTSG